MPAFLEAELDYNGTGLAASTRHDLGTDNLADWVPAFLAARHSRAVTAPAVQNQGEAPCIKSLS
ncbi:hypothetical protein D3C86_2201890 [compost metagenome]